MVLKKEMDHYILNFISILILCVNFFPTEMDNFSLEYFYNIWIIKLLDIFPK